jgi:hypothetical protein
LQQGQVLEMPPGRPGGVPGIKLEGRVKLEPGAGGYTESPGGTIALD